MPAPYEFEHLLNAIADPIFVKDRQHRWVILNDACCKLIGRERSTLIGKSDYDVFPKSEADVFWHMDEQVFNTGLENDNDEEFTDAAGVKHFITTKKILHTSPSGEKFIVGCIRDLTERNRIERELQRARHELEQKVQERTNELAAANIALSRQIAEHDRTAEQLRHSQKMEAIGQLAGGVAHDFNNLLNVIIGYGSLIEHWPGSDRKLHDTATHIVKAAETAASLTRQLLAFSRKQVLQAAVLDVNELVNSVGTMLRRLIGEYIELEIKTSPDAGSIKVDPGQFEQVIINLAVNARDAMPNGGKLILETASITTLVEHPTAKSPSRKHLVAVKVTDTGKGMQPEVQAHIFEPFFTTKEQGKGTGLGLATVYGIITQSNGTISVQSTPGAGTTFTILLPRMERHASVAVSPTELSLPSHATGTILLVEDQPNLRKLFRQVLGSHGYTVLEAASGAEAITVAHGRTDIDLLITDIVMPGMRGWELARKLTALSPKLKVLYISGHTDTDLISEGGLLAGGTFMEKPFRPELLLLKVQELLNSDAPSSAATSASPSH